MKYSRGVFFFCCIFWGSCVLALSGASPALPDAYFSKIRNCRFYPSVHVRFNKNAPNRKWLIQTEAEDGLNEMWILDSVTDLMGPVQLTFNLHLFPRDKEFDLPKGRNYSLSIIPEESKESGKGGFSFSLNAIPKNNAEFKVRLEHDFRRDREYPRDYHVLSENGLPIHASSWTTLPCAQKKKI